MIEQHQVDLILNHQLFYPGVAFVGVVFLLIVLKFLVGSRSPDSSRSLEDAPKTAGKRSKKGKKQRTLQEKKASDSPKSKKESRKNEMDRLVETDRRDDEDTKSDKKKDGKSKTKSKKRKNQAQATKVESTTSKPQLNESAVDSGEWKTVSTKEQREQQKREKRKLEEDVAVAVETAEKASLVPLVQPVYKPTSNISAIAKGIAPRFARAAGETWQEKPAVAPVLPLQSKRPMPPATVPGTTTQPSQGNTVNQGWVPGNQGQTYWPGDMGPSWPNSSQSTNTSNLPSDLIGMSWPPSDPTSSLLSMATSGDKGSVPGWPQGGSTWQATGATAGNMTWDISTEDWVHVNNGPNGRSINTNTDWPNGESPIRTQITTTTTQKVEEWTLEPEGFPIHPPQLDPNDPWNIEVVETEPNGDWSAPVSTWDNTNEEWKAPVTAKPAPTYIDESSDDDRISTKITSYQQNSTIVTGSTSPQAIVGAGPEFITQASGQGQTKKSRRRRKKKTGTNEPEQMTSSSPQQSMQEVEIPKFESPDKKELKTETITKDESPVKTTVEEEVKEQPSTEETKDDWSVSKVAKKRKNKARKAD